MKMIKRKIFCSVIALIFLIIIQPSLSQGAHAVCGKVNDSVDGVAAAWYVVSVYYENDRENYAACEISPADNKYCCDAEAIPKHTWEIGDIVVAEIVDLENAYIAGPVFVVTTNTGYDVFPEMQLEPLITIISPEHRIYLNNSILLNITTLEPYNRIWYVLNQTNSTLNQTLCSNCNNVTLTLDNLEYGQYELVIYAAPSNSSERIFSKKVSFALLDSIEFKRGFQCEGCKKNVVPSSKAVNITLEVNLSYEIDDFYLMDYYPDDWLLESANEGSISSYSKTHSMIRWKVSGKYIRRNYTLKSPKLFLPKRYIFQSELGKEKGKNYSVLVRKFPFFSRQGEYNTDSGSESRKRYLKGNPAKPLIIQPAKEKVAITRIIIKPNKKVNGIWTDILALEKNPTAQSLSDVYQYLYFDTNLEEGELANLVVEFKVEKSWVDENGYDAVMLLAFHDNEWEELNTTEEDEDDTYKYYKAVTNKLSIFAIAGVRKEIHEIGKTAISDAVNETAFNNNRKKENNRLEIFSLKGITGMAVNSRNQFNKNFIFPALSVFFLCLILFFYLIFKNKKLKK
jgi:PGF-pre-PGF domain-containing protein